MPKEIRKYQEYSLIALAELLAYAEDDGDHVQMFKEGNEFFKVEVEFDGTLLQPYDLRVNDLWVGAHANKGTLIEALDMLITLPTVQ